MFKFPNNFYFLRLTVPHSRILVLLTSSGLSTHHAMVICRRYPRPVTSLLGVAIGAANNESNRIMMPRWPYRNSEFVDPVHSL